MHFQDMMSINHYVQFEELIPNLDKWDMMN